MNILEKLTPVIHVNIWTFMTLVHIQWMPAGNIIQKILGFHLESQEAKNIEQMMRRLGETALTLIRRERIEPQSPMAFHVYARVVKILYRIGAAIELKRLGYKFEQVNLPNLGGGMAQC